MRCIVIIPTAGRKGILPATLKCLEQQTHRPDEVIVSAPDGSHVGIYRSDILKLTYVFGQHGLTAQRNQALESVLGRCDIVTFFDDDFLPAASYIERLLAAFERNDDWAVITGNVIKDGIGGPGLTVDEGHAALAQAATQTDEQRVTDIGNAYGCNMSFRTRDVGELRFDERLVLYGWQEDVDFTRQLAHRGRIIRLHSLLGVHLGAKTGRISGVRLGYSQLVNPIYLMRKGTVPTYIAAQQILRNVAANIVRSVRPEPWIDRRGRLRGNLLAAAHLMRQRIEPEHVLKL
jgi:glycosyltransferase involved in cell wall biosynthesis